MSSDNTALNDELKSLKLSFQSGRMMALRVRLLQSVSFYDTASL